MSDPTAITGAQVPTLGDVAADLIEGVACALAAGRMNPRALHEVLIWAALHKHPSVEAGNLIRYVGGT